MRTQDMSTDPGLGTAPGSRRVPQRIALWVRSPAFSRDIALVLAVKFVLLIALKYAFFNHATAVDMAVPSADVARALLSTLPSRPHQGVGHAQ
jgi:hypothetical protein